MGGQGSGRRPAPTKVKELKGEKRADRRNNAEPVPGVGDISPPSNLSAGAGAVWDRLAPDLTAQGVLTPWDVDAFAILCDAIDRSDTAREHLDAEGAVTEQPVFNRNGEKTGVRVLANPWWKVYKEAADLAAKYGCRFGWTPSDRASLKVGHDEPTAPGADLLSG